MIRATAAAILAIASLVASPGLAHAPNVSTSRLTLRDAHLEVMAEWDLFVLASATPTAIATAEDHAFTAIYEGLIATIERDTKLTVDGRPIALEVRGFPSPEEFRGLAASLSASGEDHGPIVRIRLEAPAVVGAPKTITLSSPAALGDVIASFVQPSTRYVSAGEPARFDVLVERQSASPLAASTTATAPSSHDGGVPRALGVVVGAVALTAGVTYVLQRLSFRGARP